MKRLLLFLFGLFFLSSCTSTEDKDISSALELAGNNRIELQKVLDHYSAPQDSLKLRAAEYLIANMPGKYTVTSPALEAYEDLIPAISEVKPEEGLNSPRIDNLFREFQKKDPRTADTRLRKLDDLKNITAEYLIESIDASFDTWDNSPWHNHYTFEQFCEYILPYRSMTEYLSDWKTDARKKDLWWSVNYEAITDPLVLCDSLQRKIDLTFNHGMDHYGLPQSYPNLIRSHWGNCIDETNYTLFQMRANGVPTAIDFVPQWASLHDKHFWNAILDTTGRAIDLQIGWGRAPGKVDLREKVAKIYRKTYTIQRNEIIYKKLGKEDIPPVFRTCDVYDVTAQYNIPVTDVPVEINNSPKNSTILYLCVSALQGWEPVAYAEIKGRKAVFKDVATGVIHNEEFNTKEKNLGKGIVLLPAYYREGKVVPAKEPFILTNEGKMLPLTPDATCKRSVVLMQKMRIPYRFAGFAQQLVGNRFEGANRPDFSDAITLTEIKDSVRSHLQTLPVNDSKKYRYIRYVDDQGNRTMIGELAFYDENGKILSGTPIGVKDRYWYEPKNLAFDGDIVTFYEAEAPKSWIGLDLGKSQKISAVGFSPRTPGNDVEPGDIYTLYYWDSGWKEIATKKAGSHEITFDNVPENALLLLSDRSKGREERIFTYENGRQVWW